MGRPPRVQLSGRQATSLGLVDVFDLVALAAEFERATSSLAHHLLGNRSLAGDAHERFALALELVGECGQDEVLARPLHDRAGLHGVGVGEVGGLDLSDGFLVAVNRSVERFGVVAALLGLRLVLGIAYLGLIGERVGEICLVVCLLYTSPSPRDRG